jgi:hypothetical protein
MRKALQLLGLAIVAVTFSAARNEFHLSDAINATDFNHELMEDLELGLADSEVNSLIDHPIFDGDNSTDEWSTNSQFLFDERSLWSCTSSQHALCGSCGCGKGCSRTCTCSTCNCAVVISYCCCL